MPEKSTGEVAWAEQGWIDWSRAEAPSAQTSTWNKSAHMREPWCIPGRAAQPPACDPRAQYGAKPQWTSQPWQAAGRPGSQQWYGGCQHEGWSGWGAGHFRALDKKDVETPDKYSGDITEWLKSQEPSQVFCGDKIGVGQACSRKCRSFAADL